MARKILMTGLILSSMTVLANAPIVQGHPTSNSATVTNTPVTPPTAAATTQTPDQALVTAADNTVSSTNPGDVSTQISMLQQQVQDLRGQLEVQQHIISQLQTAMAQVSGGKYQVIDPSVAAASAAVSAPALTPAQPAAASSDNDNDIPPATSSATVPDNHATLAAGNMPDEYQMYQTAYNLISAKQYKQAAAALQNYLQKYPNGQYAANSHYWLGELALMNGNASQAQQQFNIVVSQFAKSPKAPDSMLKLGMIYTEQMQWTQAKAQFNAVIKQYPGTSSAQLAQQQLTQIQQAGN